MCTNTKASDNDAEMSVDQKTWLLAVCLEGHILSRIEDAEDAQQLLDEHKRTGNSAIAHMAEYYFDHQQEFHIVETIAKVGMHVHTKLSIIRDSISKVLMDYIEDVQNGGVQVILEPSLA